MMAAKFCEIEYVTDAYGNLTETRFVPTIAPNRFRTHIDLDELIGGGLSFTMNGINYDVDKDKLYAAIRRALEIEGSNDDCN